MKKYLFFTLIILIQACDDKNKTIEDSSIDSTPIVVEKKESKNSLFTLKDPSETGVFFLNKIIENVDINVIRYDYMYNGAGVGIGDFNNDGLKDVYFTGNQVDDQMYLNKGDFKFEDISVSAGIQKYHGWSTGVSVVDINSDGWDDLYISRSGPSKDMKRHRNLLWINNKDNTFTESAEEYGLSFTGYCTQALFFDLENDGDLDMYLVTHPSKFAKKMNTQQVVEDYKNGLVIPDQLFRNDNGKYKNISKEINLFDIGYGLGVQASDFNNDGLLDIYIGNDYDEGDIMYINQGDGTFKNEITTYLRHTSNYTMGLDIADINNDGLMDIYTLDMAFETHIRSKRLMATMDIEKFHNRIKLGWHYQYMHNNLHLNTGEGTYSEISQLLGVNKTDWSWSTLFVDFDMDGYQDLFVSNGYKRDTKDNDFTANTKLLKKSKGGAGLTVDEILGVLPSEKIRNYVFKNKGGLKFERKNTDWGLNEYINSNGAAYVDIDNDGDLDLILNNVDEIASIYENTAKDKNYLVIETEENYVKVELRNNGNIQIREKQTIRGYLSSVDDRIFFGFKEDSEIDSLIIHWSPTNIRLIKNVKKNQFLTISKKDGKKVSAESLKTKYKPIFENVLAKYKLEYKHEETEYNDFANEILLPHKYSELGPFISTGNILGNGLDQSYIGGAKGVAGKILIQETGKNTFIRAKLPEFEKDKNYEDMGSVIFDFDNDGDDDLYVISGGNESPEGSKMYEDRLYENLGMGGLKRTTGILPDGLYSSGMRVIAEDLNGDGFKDLLVGGRIVPGKYPFAPKSYYLQFDGEKFVDKTNELAPEFSTCGMVTDIKSFDKDNDGDLDIIVVGEWMTPMIFENDNGKLINVTSEMIPDNMSGWWYSVAVDDLDGDGDLDIVVGNLGENNKFHPKEGKPLSVYANDFDENGTVDIVLAKYEGETLYPVRGKECSTEQMPYLAKKFKTFKKFATADLEDIYTQEKLDAALHYEVTNFSTGILWNDGGKYTFEKLPIEAQFSTVNDILIFDMNKDGIKDILIVGNNYSAEVETTRYDAGNGLVLINKGNHVFDPLTVLESGFNAPGNAKDMQMVTAQDGTKIILVANSNQIMQAFGIVELKEF